MSKYTISFKKDDISVEFMSTDKVFVSKEMEKWVNNISETVISTKKPVKEKEIISEQKTEKSEPPKLKESKAKADFSNVLEKKVVTIDEKKIEKKREKNSLDDFILIKKPATSLDFLIITAFYLGEKELLERFSLKQLNAKILKFTQKPIDHSVIHEAVTKKLIEVVPDYTGMADVTEYRLTENGEIYFKNEL